MGTIKTTNIEPIADNGTVTLGSSGDTFTIPSGATLSNSGIMTGQNYPAFHVYLNTTQTISNDTFTVVSFNTESLDTDNAYDTSTYRFTPQVAGKYFIYASIANNPSGSANIQQANIRIRKNGSDITQYQFSSGTYPVDEIQLKSQIIVDLNGSSDYVDVRGQQAVSAGTNRFAGDLTLSRTYLGGYRIGS
jgi:hypothetical protein